MTTRGNGQSLTTYETLALGALGTIYSDRVQASIDAQIAGTNKAPLIVKFYEDEHVGALADVIEDACIAARKDAYNDGRKQGQADLRTSAQLANDLTSILGRYAGERFTSEGAVEVLNRLIAERDAAQGQLRSVAAMAAGSNAKVNKVQSTNGIGGVSYSDTLTGSGETAGRVRQAVGV